MCSTIDIVIAHFQEDLSWLPVDQAHHYYIYTKSPDFDYNAVLKRHSKVNIIRLPNIGRESHTYLYHILQNYERLASANLNTTLFLQGKIRDHLKYYNVQSESESELITSLLKDAIIFGKSKSTAKAWPFKDMSAHPSFKLYSRHAIMQHAEMPLSKWFCNHIAPIFPDEARWWVGALFAIRSDIITSRPKNYYQNIFNQLDHPNPEIGHFLERSWYYVFSNHGSEFAPEP